MPLDNVCIKVPVKVSGAVNISLGGGSDQVLGDSEGGWTAGQHVGMHVNSKVGFEVLAVVSAVSKRLALTAFEPVLHASLKLFLKALIARSAWLRRCIRIFFESWEVCRTCVLSAFDLRSLPRYPRVVCSTRVSDEFFGAMRPSWWWLVSILAGSGNARQCGLIAMRRIICVFWLSTVGIMLAEWELWTCDSTTQGWILEVDGSFSSLLHVFV